MNKGVVWNKERCAQCGNCVAHCPTHALHIADAASRRVDYREEDCIECLACLENCPFAACTAAY